MVSPGEKNFMYRLSAVIYIFTITPTVYWGVFVIIKHGYVCVAQE